MIPFPAGLGRVFRPVFPVATAGLGCNKEPVVRFVEQLHTCMLYYRRGVVGFIKNHSLKMCLFVFFELARCFRHQTLCFFVVFFCFFKVALSRG